MKFIKYRNTMYPRPMLIQLKSMLGNPEDFIKLKPEEQKNIKERLKNFSVSKKKH